MSKLLTALVAVARFLNLLEPGKRILSITKTLMWVCVFAVVASLFGRPIDLPTIAIIFSTSALYAWRRYVQWKTGTILGETPASDPSADPTIG